MSESNEAKAYVRTGEHGAMRVGAGRVMLDSVVAAFRQGHSPETIRAQYPALSLEEVYGAITYCLAHSQKVQDYLRRQETIWRQGQTRSQVAPSPVAARRAGAAGGV